MIKKILYVLMAIFAISIGIYPILYFLSDESFGLLGNKPPELVASPVWRAMFYTHIIGGGISLLTGWSQFSAKLRQKRLNLHRRLGQMYVIAVMAGSISGIYIGFFATGGWVPALGFILLGLVWFYTTLYAYLHIRKKQLDAHRRMMVFSYAACLAAVTLRLWLPLLIAIFGDFMIAYAVVAWWCWIPNMLVAYRITRS